MVLESELTTCWCWHIVVAIVGRLTLELVHSLGAQVGRCYQDPWYPAAGVLSVGGTLNFLVGPYGHQEVDKETTTTVFHLYPSK